jgi:16S rRNA (cytosine967-C5)-methyltransferase
LSDNPRRAAFLTLKRLDREDIFAETLVGRELASGRLSGPDRGLFTELVYGVLRRRGSLDHLVSLFAGRSPQRLEHDLLQLLRLGLYQLFFLERIPPSAAVNETVNLAGEFVPRAKGLVNAVLRRADRERDSVTWPDPAAEPAAYLAARHSHPLWLAERWVRELGFDEAERLAEALSEPPPFTVRVNLLKTTREELTGRLEAEGAPARETEYAPAGLRIVSLPGPVTSLPSFREGLFTVQDESSQLAALLLDPRPGDRVLDACAAPGGKATYLAELMGDTGTLLACDRNPQKISLIGENVRRIGLTSVETRVVDAAALPPELRQSFDRVLLDAPCSGLGVLRRMPEGKWRKSPEDIPRLAARQRELLESVSTAVAPGGILVYSTCSTSVEENEDVVDDFLSRHPGFMIEDGSPLLPGPDALFTDRGFFRSWPHRHGMDGFFAARLRRKTV